MEKTEDEKKGNWISWGPKYPSKSKVTKVMRIVGLCCGSESNSPNPQEEAKYKAVMKTDCITITIYIYIYNCIYYSNMKIITVEK